MRRVILAALLLACGPEKKTLPPLGETLVYVDTDMPVPRLVSRLRVDFYTANHVWYGSRDLSRGKAEDFPASFGVYIPDSAREREVLLRLRAYPEGEARDYRGERFVDRPEKDHAPLDLTPLPEPTDLPRLVAEDGSDATPLSEPAPNVTIDRLLRVTVKPNERSSIAVVLRGACVGTMADVAREATCIDTEAVRAPAAEIPAAAAPTKSLVGSYDFAQKCTASPRSGGAPLWENEACVDGALFILGSSDAFGFGLGNGGAKRVAILPPFRIDKHEVTTARWRAAITAGFASPDATPFANDAPIPAGGTDVSDPQACTWSTTAQGREDFPLTCVSFDAARAFCKFLGGDLPSEAQWEYVTMHAGRPAVTPFAWGGDPGIAATCDQAWFGRGILPLNNECNKDAQHFGPGPVNERAGPNGDVSIGLGVVNLIGGVTELTLDAYASLSSNCWSSQPLHAPGCFDLPDADTALRGASWAAPHSSVFGARRIGLPPGALSPEVGFRCVRPGI